MYGTEKPVGSIVSDYKKTQDGGNWISSINGISPEDTTYQKTTMRVDNKFDPSKNSNDGAMIISGLAAIALPTTLFLGPSIAGLGAEASILFDTVSINLTTKVTTLGIIANQYFNTEAGRHNAQIILGAFSGIIKGGLDSSRAGKGAGEILQDMFWGGITGAAFGKIFGNVNYFL